MGTGCPGCGRDAEVGALCRACAGALPACDGLLPDHLQSRVVEAGGWLIDGFGVAHAVAARTSIGRSQEADLVILNGSVSRDHAELVRGADGWQVRDLGSRNGTHVDGQRVNGRAPLPEVGRVRFGDVPFLFVGKPLPLASQRPPSIGTTRDARSAPFRYLMRGEGLELCLLAAPGPDADPAGGALLHRRDPAAAWGELSLPPLEFQLLRALCARAVEEGDSPSRSRGCVTTKQLARQLPFQSRYANEENVRQLVRRVRGTLREVGAEELVEALPGRGYYVAWPVSLT